MRPWNESRFVRGDRKGFVESYFFVIAEPRGNRALWIKATVLAPKGAWEDALASAWAIGFDRGARVWAVKESVLWVEARFPGRQFACDVGGLSVRSDMIVGTVRGADGRRVELELDYEVLAGPLVLYPTPLFYTGPWPKMKLVTPVSRLRARGRILVDGSEWRIDDWVGMQGHNWGRAHVPDYTWVFANSWEGGEEAVFEAVSASVELPGSGGRGMPAAAALLRLDGREFRFNRVLQILSNRAWRSGMTWGLEADGPEGRLEVRAWARPEWFAGLTYRNPDGRLVFCTASMVALAELTLEARRGGPRRLRSTAAALEFGSPRPMPLVEVLA